MYDGKMIDFNADFELNYILKNNLKHRKKESISNREIIKKIGDFFKIDNNVRSVYHREDFYAYVDNHKLYSTLENFN